MFFNWFNTKEVDEFADSVIADLVKRMPPGKVDVKADKTGRKAVEKVRKAHDAIFKRIETFASTTRLNIYKKARLGNRIKWALTEAGYPAGFIDALTMELLTAVTYAPRRPS